jgi:hypothetical protein
MPDPYRESTEEKPKLSPAPPAAAGSLEQEVLELERQLATKKAALQEKDLSVDLSAKALASAEALPSGAKAEKPLEQVLAKEKLAISPTSAPAVTPAVVSAPPEAAAKQEAQKLKGIEKNQQLKALVDLAFLKGVSYATEVARHLDSPYLMDEFHDTLIDEFHQKLVESGKLEEI